jgi:hypothetical protein
LEATEWSWTPIFLDVDLDGFEDVLVSNGFERDGMNVDVLRRIEMAKREKKLSNLELLHLRKMFPRLDTPNVAFRNSGHLEFTDASEEWGFNARGVSQGMALADLDNDGDMDVVINNSNDPASVYRNNCPAPRIAVRLKGSAPNTFGIGARIKVGEQSQEMISGGRYLSSDEPMRCFAARETIEVIWRNGTRSVVTNAQPNSLYEICESSATPAIRESKPTPKPWFQDVSHLLNHSLPVEPMPEFPPLWSPLMQEPGPTLAWIDLDKDGWEDLCVGTNCFRNNRKGGFTATDHSPPRVLIQELDPDILQDYSGFWRTAATGDFNGDGRQDFVGGNLGLNSKYESFKDIQVYKGDLNVVGAMEYLEAYRDRRGRELPLQPSHLVAGALPWIREQFPTAEAYAKVTFPEIYGEYLKRMRVVGSRFASTVFLRRGDAYSVVPLPAEAQLAPVSAICAADFDGDGKQDLFLAQNLFAVHPETSRFDAGRGLLLEGQGDGNFRPVPGQESGIMIYGEQLSAAACDYDHDGRVDLVVTQTGAQTKLYKNVQPPRK